VVGKGPPRHRGQKPLAFLEPQRIARTMRLFHARFPGPKRCSIFEFCSVATGGTGVVGFLPRYVEEQGLSGGEDVFWLSLLGRAGLLRRGMAAVFAESAGVALILLALWTRRRGRRRMAVDANSPMTRRGPSGRSSRGRWWARPQASQNSSTSLPGPSHGTVKSSASTERFLRGPITSGRSCAALRPQSRLCSARVWCSTISCRLRTARMARSRSQRPSALGAGSTDRLIGLNCARLWRRLYLPRAIGDYVGVGYNYSRFRTAGLASEFNLGWWTRLNGA
jgi:hypothetical protein